MSKSSADAAQPATDRIVLEVTHPPGYSGGGWVLEYHGAKDLGLAEADGETIEGRLAFLVAAALSKMNAARRDEQYTDLVCDLAGGLYDSVAECVVHRRKISWTRRIDPDLKKNLPVFCCGILLDHPWLRDMLGDQHLMLRLSSCLPREEAENRLECRLVRGISSIRSSLRDGHNVNDPVGFRLEDTFRERAAHWRAQVYARMSMPFSGNDVTGKRGRGKPAKRARSQAIADILALHPEWKYYEGDKLKALARELDDAGIEVHSRKNANVSSFLDYCESVSDKDFRRTLEYHPTVAAGK